MILTRSFILKFGETRMSEVHERVYWFLMISLSVEAIAAMPRNLNNTIESKPTLSPHFAVSTQRSLYQGLESRKDSLKASSS